MNRYARTLTILITLLLLAGCGSDDTLPGAFKQQMKDDGNDSYTIFHLEERDGLGLVLAAGWSQAYPENEFRPGVFVFEQQDGGWEGTTGTGCSNAGISRLGLMGRGYLYCSVLRDDMKYERILVGDTEVKLFELGDGAKVWLAVTDDAQATIRGVTGNGSEQKLN